MKIKTLSLLVTFSMIAAVQAKKVPASESGQPTDDPDAGQIAKEERVGQAQEKVDQAQEKVDPAQEKVGNAKKQVKINVMDDWGEHKVIRDAAKKEKKSSFLGGLFDGGQDKASSTANVPEHAEVHAEAHIDHAEAHVDRVEAHVDRVEATHTDAIHAER